MIAKQQEKKEQTHLVCLHTAEKYEKVESVSTQNGYQTASKNDQLKRKQTCSLCFVYMFKFQENKKINSKKNHR